MIITYRGVAQLVARLLWEQDVAGSNPVIPTTKGVPAVRGGAFGPRNSDSNLPNMPAEAGKV